MKNFMKKIAVVLVFTAIVLGTVSAQSIRERVDLPYAGKTVILHTNDVHGAIEGYAYLPVLRKQFEDQGAHVIIIDAGDFTNGNTYVSYSKGQDSIYLMNASGYDLATFGNHEFDFGYVQLMNNISQADFDFLCADVLDEAGNPIALPIAYFDYYGTSVMFIGLETPETQTKVNPAYVKSLTFLEGGELYYLTQELINFGKQKGIADIVVVVSHLGVDEESFPNRSYDLYNSVEGIDFIIDAHSHTVMTEGASKEPIQSTGTAFENIGVIVIDNIEGKIESNYLIPTATISSQDETVLSMARAIIEKVDNAYGTVFAQSAVELNGERSPGNRDRETNLGDLITDALKWFVVKEGNLKVSEDNVVAITNGGGIRATINAGDVSMNDIKTVLPFGNTVTVVYLKGSDILEALEASTYSLPVGGFPQVAGIAYTLDTTQEYAPNAESYPDSTYFGPAEIKRVTINSINGKDFNPDAVYAVVTNDFCAAGGDTYYAFARTTDQFDTNIPMDEVLMNYISEELQGVIGVEYSEPLGRINIIY